MNKKVCLTKVGRTLWLLAGCWLLPGGALAASFSSGSTGVDGAFNPTASQTIDLPTSGVFNYTSVNIPTGVTINYHKNSSNTPVVILASGDVTIAGTIDVSGGNTPNGCDGNPNTGNPGLGGPGGFDGGNGGINANNRQGLNGRGLGGGGGGTTNCTYQKETADGGGGGGYLVTGANSSCKQYFTFMSAAVGGSAYGSAWLTPLLGGSGGGGGSGALDAQGYFGTGGGGGGGAILIVASGKVTISGSVKANGGNSGACITSFGYSSSRYSGTGGGGSGGGIRIVAADYSAMSANAAMLVAGGSAGSGRAYCTGGNGSPGYFRTETYTGGTFSFLGTPTLTFTKVNNAAVTQNPTGLGDVELSADTQNPVTVELASSNVPVGTVVTLIVAQQRGNASSFNSSPLAGSMSSGTATASVNIPLGMSTLYAQATFTTTLAMGDALSTYAQGERVEQIRLETVLKGTSTATLITGSGKEYAVPATWLAMAGAVNDR